MTPSMRREIDQVGLAELALLHRRLRGQGCLADLVERPHRLDLERLAVLAVDLAALEHDASPPRPVVARPFSSRVKTSFSPWYMPRSAGNAKTFSDSSVSGSISIHSMSAYSLPSFS